MNQVYTPPRSPSLGMAAALTPEYPAGSEVICGEILIGTVCRDPPPDASIG